LLYLNPLTYFCKLESDPVRADRFEGTHHVFQPASLKKFTITNNVDGSEIVIPPSDLAGPILVALNSDSSCNAYCMFAVTRPVQGPLVDERVLGFGDAFVIVLDTQKFIDRFCTAAKTAGFGYEYRLVEYYDPDMYSGKTGPFQKPSTFDYQQEFRMILRPGGAEPIRLVVGSLLDITTPIHSLSELNSIVDFGTESARRAGLT
jgi:hypothetical protein